MRTTRLIHKFTTLVFLKSFNSVDHKSLFLWSLSRSSLLCTIFIYLQQNWLYYTF